MRLLITGGAGCLGSSLVERHLSRGSQVSVIDNLATGTRSALPDAAALTFLEASIADPEVVRAAFDRFRPTHVIHAAASYKDPSDWSGDAATNILGSINVARACERVGVERLVNLQTALCYGRPEQVPIPVDHRLAPFTSYGVSKTAGEAALLASEVDVVSLRLANVCGPRLSIGPLPTFYRRLTAGQDCFATEAVRDFIDMSDFLDVVDIVLDSRSPRGTYNVSSGEGHSILEVLREVALALDLELGDLEALPIGADDVLEVVLDPALTEERLGWRTATGFRETVRRQVEWYQAHGTGEIFSHLADPRAAAKASSTTAADEPKA